MSEYRDYGFRSGEATHAHAYIAGPLLEYLHPHKNKLILDLGCGNGALARHLISQGYNVYGTDASEKGIAIADAINPGLFAVQDLASDDIPPSLSQLKFDTIISTEVIEHLYDPRKFVDFAKRLLLKNGGGEFLISTPYHGYLKNLILALGGKWDSHANPLWDGGHIKLWSKKTLESLLEEKGFRITGFKGCGRFPYLWKSMLIRAEIGRV